MISILAAGRPHAPDECATAASAADSALQLQPSDQTLEDLARGGLQHKSSGFVLLPSAVQASAAIVPYVVVVIAVMPY